MASRKLHMLLCVLYFCFLVSSEYTSTTTAAPKSSTNRSFKKILLENKGSFGRPSRQGLEESKRLGDNSVLKRLEEITKNLSDNRRMEELLDDISNNLNSITQVLLRLIEKTQMIEDDGVVDNSVPKKNNVKQLEGRNKIQKVQKSKEQEKGAGTKHTFSTSSPILNHL